MFPKYIATLSTCILLSTQLTYAQEVVTTPSDLPIAAAQSPLFSNKDSLQADIHELQHAWAHIKYEINDEDSQEAQMQLLAEKAATVTTTYPDRAEPKIWQAIITSSLAGIKGGLGALGLVKTARNLLLEAEKIDPTALNGSIYTSLGSLYYQVPGWPIGFGDSHKARAYLEQARAINPDGIDPNYFYGDFLYEEGDYAQAIPVLEHALLAPARPERPVADAGRKKEITELLKKAHTKLGG